MAGYAEDFAKEEQLYTLYMRKAEHHKLRMESLKCLMGGEQDELDAAASLLVGASSISPSENKQLIGSAGVDYPKRRMSGKTIQLFQFIGLDGKLLTPLVEFSERNGFDWKDHNIRNMMMQYRKNYDFIESPKPGFYKLTQKGLDAINKQLDEDKKSL